MAHRHQCRYCEEFFVCPEDAAECFADFITCDDCFWETDLIRFFIVMFLVAVAAWLTWLVAVNWKSL